MLNHNFCRTCLGSELFVGLYFLLFNDFVLACTVGGQSLGTMLIVFSIFFWGVVLIFLCLLCFFIKRKPKVLESNQDHIF